MIYRDFAKTGLRASVVGMGTYYDPAWIALAMILKVQQGRGTKIQALKAGLDAGINFIDTAEIYQSETIVAEAISGRKRDELFIASKVWSNHLQRGSVLKSCEKSLSRLKTQYVDLYQVHFPSSRVPIKETMGAMEELMDQGKIRAIGVSNFSLSQMEEAEAALSKHELSSTQMDYSLIHRDIEKDILPHCQEKKIAVIAYYPLGHGKLASGPGANRVADVAKSRNLQPAQVALSWLFSKSNNVFPIPRASRIVHVRANAEAGNVVLTSEEVAALDKAFS